MGHFRGQNTTGTSNSNINNSSNNKKESQPAAIKPVIVLVTVGDGKEDNTERTHPAHQVNVFWGEFEILHEVFQALHRGEDFRFFKITDGIMMNAAIAVTTYSSMMKHGT